MCFGCCSHYCHSSGLQKDDYKNLDCNEINAGFAADIEPVIKANCLSSGCHDSGSRHGDFTEYKGIKGKANNGSLEKECSQKKTCLRAILCRWMTEKK